MSSNRKCLAKNSMVFQEILTSNRTLANRSAASYLDVADRNKMQIAR